LINKKAQQIALDFEIAMQDPWKTNSLSINIYAMQDNNQQKNCVICNNHFTAPRRKTCSSECSKKNIKRHRQLWQVKNLLSPEMKIRARVRSRYYHLCKSYQLPYKTTPKQSQIYLGISIEEYITYLESKFVDGMNWDNMDEWQIDHIIPFRSFDLTNEEEMFKAFNYTNTQPLFVKEHQIKSIIERGKTVHINY